jgi:hypothetical protein
LGGKSSFQSSLSEVWAYNISNNSWIQKNNLPFGCRWRASSIGINNIGYLGFGKDEANQSSSDFYSYDATTDSWAPIATFPGDGRTYAGIEALNTKLYIMFGINDSSVFYSDCWEYNPIANTWSFVNNLPSTARRGGGAFSSSNSIYYTSGINENFNRLKETWRFSLPAELDGVQFNSLNIYPNPNNGQFSVYIDSPEIFDVQISDIHGKIVKQISKIKLNHGLNIDISELENSLYIIRAISGSQTFQKRIAVNK